MFDNIKNNLQTISSDLFMIINNVESKTEEINHKLLIIDLEIKKEKDKNKKLKKQMGLVYNENNGSNEMIDDFKKMYNNNYLKNWALFIGIIISIILLMTFNKSTSLTKVDL